MLIRWAIRVGTSLVGIAIGIIVSSVVLSKFSIDAAARVEATFVIWLVHLWSSWSPCACSSMSRR